MEAKDKRVITEEIIRKFPGTDPEIDIDWDMMEISFKAGWQEGWDKADEQLHSPEVLRIVENDLKEAELRGIGEVVGWIRDNCIGDPRVVGWVRLEPEEWQAQLEEWGIKGGE